MHAKNSNGPSTLPHGTPLVTSVGLEEEPLHVECVYSYHDYIANNNLKNQKSSSKHFLEFHSIVVLLAIGGQKPY